DIPLLAARFIEDFTQRHGKRVTGIAAPLRKAMAAYDWPGNVRELRNLIESLVVQDTDGILDLDDLQEGDSLCRTQMPQAGGGPANLVGRPLTEVERYYIEKTLELTEGNREEAAKKLGIGERTLYRVIQDWKVQDRIKAALDEAGGDLEKAAEALNLKLPALQRKIKKWGMQVE